MKRTTTLLALLALQACSKTEAPTADTRDNAPAAVPAAVAAPETSHTVAGPIDEAAILAEKDAQWASSAEASTSFNDASGSAGYAPSRATGQPDVPRYADHPNAWATRNGDANTPDWLHVGFDKPVHARSLRIRQTAAPGAISKIELLDASGAAHVVWEGTDTTTYGKDTIGWMIRDFDVTPYKVTAARITLQTNRIWGWNEIDAVQLVGVEALELEAVARAQN
jgi:hypothetical protein